MKIKSLYLIRALANLHPGSGDTNYGIIDRLVQRDAATNLPCMHGSGIKGAMKQQLHEAWQNNPAESSKWLRDIFGSDSTVNTAQGATPNHGSPQQGKTVFTDAYLLALPVPTTKFPFVLVTCPTILMELQQRQEELGSALAAELTTIIKKLPTELGEKIALTQELNNTGMSSIGGTLASIDKIGLTAKEGNTLASFLHPQQRCALVSDATFIELCDDLNLPVIARNYLEDGQSKNLWYEQVLPRETLLFTNILWHDDQQKDRVESIIFKQPIQLGANASIGYGLTTFRTL